QRYQWAGNHSGFLQSFSSSRSLQVVVISWLSLGNAPRRLAIVVSRRVNKQDFQALRSLAVQERAGGLLHGGFKSFDRGRRGRVRPALRVQEIEFLEQGWMGRAMGETQLLNPWPTCFPGKEASSLRSRF